MGKFIGVDYSLAPIHPSRIDNQIFIEGSRWANVDEKDAKRKIRKFYERSSLPTEWAKDLQVKLKEKFSTAAIQDSYNNTVKEFV